MVGGQAGMGGCRNEKWRGDIGKEGKPGGKYCLLFGVYE